MARSAMTDLWLKCRHEQRCHRDTSGDQSSAASVL
jgi:hypothetical protein